MVYNKPHLIEDPNTHDKIDLSAINWDDLDQIRRKYDCYPHILDAIRQEVIRRARLQLRLIQKVSRRRH